jgi:hypothetical protein
MMTADDFVRYYAPTISRVAASIAKSNPGIETSDIEQEIYLRALQSNFLNRVDETSGGLVHTLATEYGTKYAMAERKAYTYFSAEYIYTPAEVRDLLDKFFDPIHWEGAPTKEKDIDIEAGGVVVALWDIRNAFEALSEIEQKTIRERHQFGISPKTSAEKMRVSRAVDKIVRHLNVNL